MVQKTKRDWWLAGITLLAAKGSQGLTIDALCQKMGVTKGSFYHHFKSYENYIKSLLDFYETEGTFDIIDQLKDLPTPMEKLKGLIDMVVKASTDYLEYPEKSIRAWSNYDESVKEVVARVDKRRLDYLIHLCEDILSDKEKGLVMGRLAYAILIGSEHMEPNIHGIELQALFDAYQDLIRSQSNSR
jgi:AcrR family transcriptional regulator